MNINHVLFFYEFSKCSFQIEVATSCFVQINSRFVFMCFLDLTLMRLPHIHFIKVQKREKKPTLHQLGQNPEKIRFSLCFVISTCSSQTSKKRNVKLKEVCFVVVPTRRRRKSPLKYKIG